MFEASMIDLALPRPGHKRPAGVRLAPGFFFTGGPRAIVDYSSQSGRAGTGGDSSSHFWQPEEFPFFAWRGGTPNTSGHCRF